MFRLLTLAIFRLYIKYLLSSYTELKWTVYRGEVGGEVGTRSRCVMEVGCVRVCLGCVCVCVYFLDHRLPVIELLSLLSTFLACNCFHR